MAGEDRSGRPVAASLSARWRSVWACASDPQVARSRCASLPVSLPSPTDRRCECATDQSICQSSVVPGPVVLEPGRVRRISIEVSTLHPQMLAVDHRSPPREEALGTVGMSAIVAERLGVVESPHVEVWIEDLPVRVLVGRDDAAGGDPLAREVDAFRFAQEYLGHSSAAALTQDNHHAAPARQPAVDTLSSLIGGPKMPAECRPSVSTSPSRLPSRVSAVIASRSLCIKTKAVLCWTPGPRDS
ncbi:hypothetical protein ACSSVZ_005389 [Amorphus sp. MBR-141]